MWPYYRGLRDYMNPGVVGITYFFFTVYEIHVSVRFERATDCSAKVSNVTIWSITTNASNTLKGTQAKEQTDPVQFSFF